MKKHPEGAFLYFGLIRHSGTAKELGSYLSHPVPDLPWIQIFFFGPEVLGN